MVTTNAVPNTMQQSHGCLSCRGTLHLPLRDRAPRPSTRKAQERQPAHQPVCCAAQPRCELLHHVRVHPLLAGLRRSGHGEGFQSCIWPQRLVSMKCIQANFMCLSQLKAFACAG